MISLFLLPESEKRVFEIIEFLLLVQVYKDKSPWSEDHS
jgi:hypothetical protein